MKSGDEIQVRALKADSTCYRWWTATVETAGTTGISTVVPSPHRIHQPNGGWTSPHAVRAHYWFDKPYNLLEVYLADGTFAELYVHIASPVKVVNNELHYIDYELDVVLGQEGQPRIVDEDEFEEAVLQYGYSREFQSHCYQAAQEAVVLVQDWPVKGLYMESWPPLKRRLASRPGWRRVTQRRFAVESVHTEDFRGHVTLICIDEIQEPLWVQSCGQHICVADRGHSWLQHFPQGSHYAMTTMFDADGEVLQWYIDICKQHGVTANGIPWNDDLYLDVLISPSGEAEVIDGDELEQALSQGLVSLQDYRLAWEQAQALLDAIQRNSFGLPTLSKQHRAWMLGKV